MLKVRDLGVNALPFDMAAKKGGGAKCAQKTCRDTSHCPITIPTGGKPTKKYSIGHDEIEQLHHQLLHKMAEDVTH